MEQELAEAALAVVTAARIAAPEIEGLTGFGEGDRTRTFLDAVDALEKALAAKAEPNEPTGFVLHRAWAEIPAGWFVQTPAGWWEVTGTRHADGKQWVSLRSPDGKSGEWPREPRAEVKVRRGTTGPTDRDVALDALRAAFSTITILEEQVS